MTALVRPAPVSPAPPPGDENAGWLERFSAPAHRIADSPAVLALRDALPASFGVLLVAVAALFLFVEHGDFATRFRLAIPGGFAIMSVVLVGVLGVRLAQRYDYFVLQPVGATIIAFFLTLPRDALKSYPGFAKTLGASGPFTAIVVAFTVCAAVLYARRITSNPFVAPTVAAVGCIAFFALLNLDGILVASLLDTALRPLGDLGDSFAALAIICAVESVLWIVGIHGPAMLAAIVLPVYINLQFQNFEAWNKHLPLPHLVVVSTFLFVFPGGAGATLPLTLLLARSRVARLRKIALASLVPGVVGTNEPLLFGLPIVFNPFLAIPFVVAPVVLVIVTYVAMATGLVAKPYVYVPSVLPFPLGVFVATLDWRAVVLALANLGIAAAIYAPFVRAYERAEAARAQA